MLSSSKEQSKFKAESSLTPTLSEIEFLVKVNVSDKEAKNCFQKIEIIYSDLRTVTKKASISETKILVSDPSEKSQRFKKFEISSESGLKDKMNASEIRFEEFLSQPKTNFLIPVYQRNYDWQNIQCYVR